MKNNLRILIDTLEYFELHTEKKLALIFLDAQKAFDNVNWEFMSKQMEAMCIGERFLGVMKNAYLTQMARVSVNGDLTKEILIKHGTRQR